MVMGDTVDGDKNGGDVNEDKTLCQIDIYLCILLFRRGRPHEIIDNFHFQ